MQLLINSPGDALSMRLLRHRASNADKCSSRKPARRTRSYNQMGTPNTNTKHTQACNKTCKEFKSLWACEQSSKGLQGLQWTGVARDQFARLLRDSKGSKGLQIWVPSRGYQWTAVLGMQKITWAPRDYEGSYPTSDDLGSGNTRQCPNFHYSTGRPATKPSTGYWGDHLGFSKCLL